MKKSFTLKTSICFVLLTLLFGCASTKSETISMDSYNDSDTPELQNENQTNDNTGTYKKTEKKKTSNFLHSLTTFGNVDRYSIEGETTLFTRTVTGSITEKKADIMIDLKNDTIGFGSGYLTQYYIVQFDEATFLKLKKAYEQYLSDFENKKLNKKSNKTYKTYGTANIHLDWGTISSSTPNNGDGKAYFGYEFKKGSPYFMISNKPFTNNYHDIVGDTAALESMDLQYYFTKAQALELINKIEECLLSSKKSDTTPDEY